MLGCLTSNYAPDRHMWMLPYCFSRMFTSYLILVYPIFFLFFQTAQNTNYQCQNCLKTFPNQSRLTYHMISHSKENLRQRCKLCGKRYANKKELKTHCLSKHGNVPGGKLITINDWIRIENISEFLCFKTSCQKWLPKRLTISSQFWLLRIWALFWILPCELAEQNSKRRQSAKQ